MGEQTDRQSSPDEPLIVVRRQWNDWRTARYHLKDFTGAHWSTLSGGVQSNAPYAFIHGYVMCNAMLDGDLAHSCLHGQGPHRIKVCVVKKDNDPSVFTQISSATGPRPAR